MKEREDDVLPRVTEPAGTVDSATADEIVTESGKFEGVLSERDEGEDVVVDVVGADVVVEDHGGTGDLKSGSEGTGEGSLGEIEAGGRDVEDVPGLGEEVCDDSNGTRVLAPGKVEVVMGEEVSKQVLQGNVVSGLDRDAEKSGNGASVGDSKVGFEPSSVEPHIGDGEIVVRGNEEVTERDLNKETIGQATELVQEAADQDDMMGDEARKEDGILDSSKIRESLMATANLGSQEVAEKGLLGKDEAKYGVYNQSLSTEVINAGTGKDVVDGSTKILDPTNQDTKIDAQKSGNGVGDSEMAVALSSKEPVLVEGETADEPKKRLTKEIVERPAESVQEVGDEDRAMIEETGKEDVLDSAKVPESETTGNLGSEEVEVVVAEEGLAGKVEAQVVFSEDSSLVNPGNRGLPTDAANAGTGEGAAHVNMDQQAEVEERSKEGSSNSTINIITNDTQESEKDTGVGNSKMSCDTLSIGLTEEMVELPRPVESVRVAGDGDHVMDEKAGKDDKVLDSSKVLESSTMPNSEEIIVVLAKEGLAANDEAQDGVPKDPSLVSLDNGAAHVNTENLDKQDEADELSKEEIPPSTSDVRTNETQKSGKETGVGDSKMDEEPSSTGLSESVVERPVESVQEVADVYHVMNEKTGRGLLDSTKVQESETIANLGSEEVDVVVAEEGLARKDEAQDGLSKDAGLACADNRVLSTEVVDAGIYESQMSKEESSRSIVGVAKDAQKSETTTCVKDSKVADEPSSQGEMAVIDTKRSVESVQGCADEDQVTVAKIKKEDGVLDSSKIPDSSTMRANIVSEEVDTVVVKEGLAIKVEPQDGVPINPSTTYDNRYLSHGDVPADSEFSYAEAHVERGEDAGMDIDEVLGWKDEIPAIGSLSGHVDCTEDQNLKINADPETDTEQVPVGHQDEDSKFRQAIVYERRVHVEVPIHDEPGSSSKDEKVTEDVEVHTEFYRDQETEALELHLEPENETSVSLQQTCYFPSPENEGEFSVSDLVWGKVRSHPWWPGQIFDPSDASEKAMKYHKKDCFLVAYFGDRTFAWNDSTVLKPFRACFSQIEKHSSSEAFKNAVNSALEEVSRRVEFGLACSCIPDEIYKKIEFQDVENAGIKQESSRRRGLDLDASAGVNSFEPDKLVDYVRLLARSPYREDNKMDLVMAKAQLSSYGRYKGYRNLAEFLFCGNLLEDASVKKSDEQILDKNAPGDGEDGLDGSGLRKRKAVESVSDGSEKRQTLHTDKIPTVLTQTPKPSFKVGECIQRVATQLTGPPPGPDQLVGSAIPEPGPENPQSGLDNMVSLLRLAAQDPMKEYSFLNTIIPFFYTHRSSVLSKTLRQNLSTDGRKRKPTNENDPEEFEFDDINDSYWTDRIIQNNPEEQLLQDNNINNNNNNNNINQNGGQAYQLVSYEPVKPTPTRRSNKKRFFSSNHEIEAKEQSELIERRRQNLATEVLLKFTEGIYFPSEIHLNKMFRRFGPLMESETEVDRQSGRARVVFKKCSDAEVAHSSAGKFNIFGSINVIYELNYNPLVSYKPLPLPVVQDPAGAC